MVGGVAPELTFVDADVEGRVDGIVADVSFELEITALVAEVLGFWRFLSNFSWTWKARARIRDHVYGQEHRVA